MNQRVYTRKPRIAVDTIMVTGCPAIAAKGMNVA
jgi:hypothetical protein